MARLIDADALGIGKAKREVFTAPEYADGWNAAIDIIDAAPTIEIDRPTRSQFKRMAVQLGYEPVVHCKNCKHSWEDIGGLCCSHGVCVDCTVPEDFFCADGERKNDFVDDNKIGEIGERRTDER